MSLHFLFVWCAWNVLVRDIIAYNDGDGVTGFVTTNDYITPDPHKPGNEGQNIKLLQTILGPRNYDHKWMSINTPSTVYNVANIDFSSDRRLKILLTFKNFTLTDENGKVISAPDHMISAMQRWMVKQATCKIDFIWKRLDDNYWPLWIKHGVCSSRESCSWPPGMSCQPNSLKKMKLLKWTCASDPLGKKWNEFRDSVLADKRKRKIRMIRQNLRKNTIKNKVAKKPFRQKRMRRLIKRYLYKTSKYAKGYLCQWKLIDYSVYKSCTCTCQ